jgi:hypothetical protein
MASRSAWLKAAVVIRPSASAVSAKYCFFMEDPWTLFEGTMRAARLCRQPAMRHTL